MTSLNACRDAIDALDKQIISYFLQRMAICEEVATIKFKNGTDIFCAERESKILQMAGDEAGEMRSYAVRLFEMILALSKERQIEITDALQKGKKQ